MDPLSHEVGRRTRVSGMRAEEHNQTALIVIDVQTGVVANGHERSAVLANINTLIDKARAADVPVIWIQHNDADMPKGSDGWEIDPELSPGGSEALVHKSLRSSFDETSLDEVLAEGSIGRLVVTGAQSDYCVRWTLHGALERGFDTMLVSDAHTTDDPPNADYPLAVQTINLLNNVWASQDTTGPAAEVAKTADVTF